MKVVIPVAGEGTRMRPHTYTQPKVLLHVAGKPMIAHILDKLVELGLKDLVLVVGYMGDRIKEYVDSNYNFNVDYVEQTELLGLGHAIWLTRDFVKDEPVLIILGDTLFKADFNKILSDSMNYIGVKEVEDARRFGIVELNEGFISRLIEKPDNPPTNLAIVGIYLLQNSNKLYSCLNKLIEENIRTKDEYQLTDALQLMLEDKEQMKTFLIDGWFDCGKPETCLLTNKKILELEAKPEKVSGSVVIDPVYISKTAKIGNSIIGPNVSIANGAIIENSIIKNSIICEEAKIKNMVLSDSIIGNKAGIKGKAYKINIGASNQIEKS